jgi:hypothetical protein
LAEKIGKQEACQDLGVVIMAAYLNDIGIHETERKHGSTKVDPKAWDAAKVIFDEYNLTVTDAINIFLNRVRIEGGALSLKSSVGKAHKGYARS